MSPAIPAAPILESSDSASTAEVANNFPGSFKSISLSGGTGLPIALLPISIPLGTTLSVVILVTIVTIDFDQILVKIMSRDSVPFARRLMSKLFYRIAARLTEGMLPESVSDFRLVNKKTYEAIRRLRENHRFLRGLGSWVGFKTTQIELERPPRFAGESKWLGTSLIGVIAHASRSILAYSATPLLWVSALGILLSGFSFVALVGLVIFWLISGVPFAGFGSIVSLIFLGFSLTMLCIGVLAQYLGLVYEEVKQRPLYILTETTNS